MDYSFLLAVHNITEEMKITQKISLLPSAKCPLPSTVLAAQSLSIHEEVGTTTSTDSGIAMSTVSNLPTYIQYLRVIEFIRAQQIPSVHSSSMSNPEHSLIETTTTTNNDNTETASIKTVKQDLSPSINQLRQSMKDTTSLQRTHSRSPMNSPELSSTFHLSNALIGGDVWYNRQNLSRLAMYVVHHRVILNETLSLNLREWDTNRARIKDRWQPTSRLTTEWYWCMMKTTNHFLSYLGPEFQQWIKMAIFSYCMLALSIFYKIIV